MKTYPSIEKVVRNLPVYAFDKLDGSNIRAEWTPKNGFCKFGAKERLLGADEVPLGRAIPIIQNVFAEKLDAIFRKQRYQNYVVCFFEFCGPNSFAGNHVESEAQTATLIDVNPYKKGILPPRDFLDLFAGEVPTAPLLYHGNCNSDFVEAVKNGTLEGMTFEGVICKYMDKKVLKMFKIKNQAWLDKLKNFCGEDAELFRRLS